MSNFLVRLVGVAVFAVFVTATSPVAAKSAKSSKLSLTKKARKSPPRLKSKRKPKKASVANAAKGNRDVAAVLKWLRKHIADTKKAGKPSDLPTQLLAGLFQLAIPNIVHGQYALAGTGQALRCGGMPKGDVQVVARDMARNFGQLSKIFGQLAATPALKGQIASFFAALAGVSDKGKAAATAMGAYAQDPNKQAGATGFESALESYRGAISGLMGRIK